MVETVESLLVERDTAVHTRNETAVILNDLQLKLAAALNPKSKPSMVDRVRGMLKHVVRLVR